MLWAGKCTNWADWHTFHTFCRRPIQQMHRENSQRQTTQPKDRWQRPRRAAYPLAKAKELNHPVFRCRILDIIIIIIRVYCLTWYLVVRDNVRECSQDTPGIVHPPTVQTLTEEHVGRCHCRIQWRVLEHALPTLLCLHDQWREVNARNNFEIFAILLSRRWFRRWSRRWFRIDSSGLNINTECVCPCPDSELVSLAR